MDHTIFHTDTREVSGVSVRIDYHYDYDHGAPWREEDGHGGVREVFSPWGHPEKSPGEVVLHSDRGTYWLYHRADATKTARADGWGIRGDTSGMTRGQVAAAAVAQDMAYLRGWLCNDWHYCGIVVTVLDEAGEDTALSDSCWGFETYQDYHETAALEMAQEVAAVALKEAAEVTHWAERDVLTTTE